MRKLTTLIISLALGAVAFAGCGDDGSSSTAGAGLVPADALVYGEVTLDPSGDQEKAIDDLLAKFPGGEDAQGKLTELIEKGLREDDAPISYKDDVEPWLGEGAAFYVGRLSPGEEPKDFAFLVQTDDADASMETVDKAAEGDAKDASYKDVDYKRIDDGAAGVVDDWLVVGTESGFKRVIDVSDGGQALDGTDAYEKASAGLPDDQLASFYVDTKGLVQALGSEQLAGLPFKDALDQPFVATVDVDADGVEVTAKVSGDAARQLAPFFGAGSDAVSKLPAGSWLGLFTPEIGPTIESAVDSAARELGGREALDRQVRAATGLTLDELVGWMGDSTAFARGESIQALDGALILETTDEAASKRALDALARLARRSGGSLQVRPLAVEGEGFTLTDPSLPQPVHVFQRDGRVVAAYGDQAARDALDPARTLEGSEPFDQAAGSLGEGYEVATYVGIDEILKLVESSGAGDSAGWREVKPYLEPLGAIVNGSKREGDDLVTSLRITVP